MIEYSSFIGKLRDAPAARFSYGCFVRVGIVYSSSSVWYGTKATAVVLLPKDKKKKKTPTAVKAFVGSVVFRQGPVSVPYRIFKPSNISYQIDTAASVVSKMLWYQVRFSRWSRIFVRLYNRALKLRGGS